jgi:hypothetical protein
VTQDEASVLLKTPKAGAGGQSHLALIYALKKQM